MPEWRPIPGFPGYEASDDGHVRSFVRKKGGRLNEWLTGRGYLSVELRAPGGRKCKRGVHGLVARTFIGKPPQGTMPNHKDGNKLNNRADNLEWVTNSENMIHAVRTGLQKRFRGPVVSDEAVGKMRAEVLSGQRVTDVARRHGVSKSFVSLAYRGLLKRKAQRSTV